MVECRGQRMPREMGGGELVYRLVAATPPYLFSQAGVPHAFFFSELLRGLVEARAKRPPSPSSPASSAQGGPPAAKRIRSASGSAFGAPGRGTTRSSALEEPPPPAPATTNPLSTSRLIPRLAAVYRTVRESRKIAPLSPVIGLELLVVGAPQPPPPQPPLPQPLKHETDLERKS